MTTDQLVALPAGATVLHVAPPGTGAAGVRGVVRDLLARSEAASATTDGTSTPAARGTFLSPDEALLGPEEAAALAAEHAPLHVVVTVRPVADLLVDGWQEALVAGDTQPWQAWLDDALRDPAAPTVAGVPVAELVARWTDAVGAENVTVVVDAAGDRTAADVAALLGLTGAVPPAADGRLTPSEVALLEAFAAHLPHAETVDAADRARLVGGIVAGLLARAGRTAPAAVVPTASADAVAQAGRHLADAVRASGARVVGDVAALEAAPSTEPTDADGAATDLPNDVVDAALVGLYTVAAKRPTASPVEVKAPAAPVAEVQLDDLTEDEVKAIVAKTPGRRLLTELRGRLKPGGGPRRTRSEDEAVGA